ncbi:MAG: transporter substrate-binding domain-containing protein [Clostridia bacterium]|nr:transporter substrate-binding domain-containing protein [Clostridia bacterium]
MKKILSLMLALAMVFSFAACGTKSETTETDANKETASGGNYSDLMTIDGLDLAVEEYGIGFRTGSDIVDEVNKIIKELYNDGTLKKIAEKYDLAANLLEPKDVPSKASGDSDLDYIKKNGKMVIGYTVYDPMNYTDDNGEFVGFDTEFAKAVCEKLGVTPEFVEINWDTKEIELNAKSIDCIWNGFTINEEREENLDFSIPYILNKQVVVIRKADKDKYTDAASLASAKLAAETASAGEDAIKDDENLSKASYTAVPKQTDALLEVKASTVDAAVLDYTLANSMVGK